MWHCKPTGGYTMTYQGIYNYPTSDGVDNCIEARNLLMSLGWTLNAVCGLLTCVAFESGYNPWRWEGNSIQSTTSVDSFPYGYGLVQWTPASDTYAANPGLNKYINNPRSINIPGYGPNYSDQTGSTLDGAAQLQYLNDDGWRGQYFSSPGYPYWGNMEPYFSDFKISTRPASDLCEVWVVNFERPGNPAGNRTRRQALASALYDLLGGSPVQRKIPVWLLFKLREENFR